MPKSAKPTLHGEIFPTQRRNRDHPTPCSPRALVLWIRPNILQGYVSNKAKEHNFTNPPTTWVKRKDAFSPPLNFTSQMDALIHFSTEVYRDCMKAEWNRWEDVLSPFPMGSLERVLWAVAFLKSTNGVADKVSCGHFRKVISNNPTISLDAYKDLQWFASNLRQTSKWVKNTFVLVNISSIFKRNGMVSR